MINRSVATPEVETRPDARLDVPHRRFHRVRHLVVVGPAWRVGEGDAAGDCCCMWRISLLSFRKRGAVGGLWFGHSGAEERVC